MSFLGVFRASWGQIWMKIWGNQAGAFPDLPIRLRNLDFRRKTGKIAREISRKFAEIFFKRNILCVEEVLDSRALNSARALVVAVLFADVSESAHSVYTQCADSLKSTKVPQTPPTPPSRAEGWRLTEQLANLLVQDWKARVRPRPRTPGCAILQGEED